MGTAAATTPSSGKGEVVSQSEIESLLASFSAGDPSLGAGGNGSDAKAEAPRQHNFPAASAFSTSELRKLRIRHEDFVRALAGRLSSYLRMECVLEMTKLETIPFQQFKESVSNPTHLALLNIEPLRGLCLLDVPPKLGLCIVDRELGGPAELPADNRDLTDMEARLVSQVIEMVAGEWCCVWTDTLDLRPSLVRHENCARFLTIHAPETLMLVIGIEFKIGKVAEKIHFALPCPTLKPLIVKLNNDGDSAHSVVADPPPASSKWNAALGNVEIRVSAEISGLEYTARRLANLKPGEVLPIGPDITDQVRVCLEGSPKFLGRLGTSGHYLAVQILKAI